jgi:SP family general alpha glucoside:H+ symporter-like MFS transporter
MVDHVESSLPSRRGSALIAVPPHQEEKNLVTVNHETFVKTADNVEDLAQLTQAAITATKLEHSMTFREAFRAYTKAILFSFGICLAIIMEGYDIGLLSSFYGLPQFREKYGHKLPDGDYQLSAAWQSSTSAISSVGSIMGLMFVGWLVDRVGYRFALFSGLAAITGAIFVVFFARNIVMLFFGELLCGIPWGMFQGLASAYAADLAPLTLRPLLTSYINLCWAMGQFLSTGVLKAVLGRSDQWAYRIPFAVQWLWPIPISLAVLFAPESPWWLMRKGRREDARRALRKMASQHVTETQLDNAVDLMYLTDEHEKLVVAGTSYLDLFKGTNLRRTEISAVTWICQVTCGIWFSSNIIYFMEQAGFDAAKAFNFGLGVNAISCLGTISSWFITPHVGRCTLYVSGLAAMLATELIVGFMYIPSNPSSSTGWAAGAILILNVLAFFVTVGPVCYIIVPEVPSVRLRNKTVVFSRACYDAFALMANYVNTPILNPTAWNLKGKGGFVWGAFCVLSLLWAFFRLPETKGRTPAELDVLFENKTRTRDFKKMRVDPFRSDSFAVADPTGRDLGSTEKL